MTDAELKELVANLVIAQQETDRLLKEHAREAEQRQKEAEQRRKEAEQRQKEAELERKETDKFLKNLTQEAEQRRKETDKFLKDLAQEAEQRRKETDKQIREMSKQLGGLGNKFGSFTEGMAFPSMERLLNEKFGMTAISPRFKMKQNGHSLELDVFAYTNGKLNQAFIVEVKSHVKEEHIEQLLMQLRELKIFAPEHKDKQIFGILAGVDVPDNMKQKILKNGLYLAMIHDEQFDLQVPKDFVAKAF